MHTKPETGIKIRHLKPIGLLYREEMGVLSSPISPKIRVYTHLRKSGDALDYLYSNLCAECVNLLSERRGGGS